MSVPFSKRWICHISIGQKTTCVYSDEASSILDSSPNLSKLPVHLPLDSIKPPGIHVMPDKAWNYIRPEYQDPQPIVPYDLEIHLGL